MSYTWKTTGKFLTFYLLIYVVVASGLYWGLKTYSQKKFSPEKLRVMMNTVSKYRDTTTDPCKYSIFGDPATSQGDYAKVFINCSADKKVTNSIDLRAVGDKTIGGVIKEIGRINGFEVKIASGNLYLGDDTKNWSCYENQKRIQDFGRAIEQKATVECFLSVNIIK